MTKEQDYQFIKKFTKISISQICRDLEIDRINVMNGKASASNIKKVKEELERRLAALQE